MGTRWVVSDVFLVLVTAAVIGCDSKEEGRVGKHEHHAPHQGTLVEFGEEFAHLEIVIDSATGQITGYVLDGEAEKPVRLSQGDIRFDVQAEVSSFGIVLKAVGNALTGEKPGDTSQFDGQADELKGLKEFDATVAKVTVKGKEFTGVKFNFPRGNEEK
ncbi:MAG TPA: hypothetical protein VE981_22775 [Planctomycetota bacterium]|nr:hypothetical protein [Planctomycetota bacterium]